MEIPVIDLAGLNGDDAAERSRTMARLHEACKDWGFFWVRNNHELAQRCWLAIATEMYLLSLILFLIFAYFFKKL